MIRLVGILVGLGFSGVVLLALLMGIGPAFSTLSEHGKFVEPTAEHEFHLYPRDDVHFPFEGVAGHWDIAQLQRGYKVYKEVCSACHSLELVHFRNLADLGYSDAQVKAEAASWQVPGVDPTTGEATTRPGLPTDAFPKPYPNAVAAAAANNKAIPPDLSLMAKARKDGTHYLVSLLTGYRDPNSYTNAEGETLAVAFPDSMPGPGLHFNPYFANLNLAMAPPLVDGQVTFDDGAGNSVEEMANDVAAFLTWTAEPKMIERKQTGWWVILFTLFATVLAWFAKKQIWAGAKPKRRDD